MFRKENVAGGIEKGWLIDDDDRGPGGRKVKKRKAERDARDERERQSGKGGIRA